MCVFHYVSQFADESRYAQNIKHLCCWDAFVLETAKNTGSIKMSAGSSQMRGGRGLSSNTLQNQVLSIFVLSLVSMNSVFQCALD